MKIRSAVPENAWLVFLRRTEKQKIEKKNRKKSVKHIRIRLIGGCVNNSKSFPAVTAENNNIPAARVVVMAL